jgi:preprotein translocase subunit SecD
MGSELRSNNIRYAGLQFQKPGNIVIQFRDIENLNQAYNSLPNQYRDYTFTKNTDAGRFELIATLNQTAIANIANYAVDQNMAILTKRVNELGVSEAVVQRQGQNEISIDLPGVQDTARAKEILGKTATLKWQLVDTDNDAAAAASTGITPLGDKLYFYENQPILIKNQVILRGDSITYATASMGENGRPAVNIRLGGGGENQFARVTAENVGKPLSVIYVETNPQTQVINGKTVTTRKQTERVINVATIQSALTNNFEITGLSSAKYAQDLALLLRSGALTAPVAIIQERTVGPSLGAANIQKGVMSLIIGTALVVLFMILYYRLFGLIADLALVLNLVFIVAILSLLGATLTLPGIAGIVLTVGMAVDANVLIFERIREELRLGMSPQASIHTGYERAFVTIVDANVTTLIVALILFALGSGSVKNFAITLTIGILTSMVTANFFTRAIVNLIYGGRSVKWLSIGIKPNSRINKETRVSSGF